MLLLTGMAQPNPALTAPATSAPATPAEPVPEAAWSDLEKALRRAAQLAADCGAESELFMQAAWAAYLDAQPGLREKLEDKELRAQLKKLRKRGLVASA
jgi:hypothetical protein